MSTSIVILFLELLFADWVEPDMCSPGDVMSHFPCPGPQWHDLDNTCIIVNRTAVTWLEARLTCLRMNGDLVSVGDQTLDIALTELLETDVNAYWIGLNSINVDGEFLWTDSRQLDYHPRESTSVLESGDSDHRCVAARRGKGGNFSWFAEDCLHKHVYVCQRGGGRVPSPPILEFENPRDPLKVLAGTTLTASCTGFTGFDGYLEFEFSSLGGEVLKGDELTTQETKEQSIERDRGRCTFFSAMRLHRLVTRNENGGVITCCNRAKGTRPTCTHGPPISVWYKPGNPEIIFNEEITRLQSERGVVAVTCVAFVGSYGRLHWVITTKGSVLNTSVGLTRAERGIEEKLGYFTIRRSPVVFYDIKGPHVRSTLVTNHTEDLSGSVISCKTQASAVSRNAKDFLRVHVHGAQSFSRKVRDAFERYADDGAIAGVASVLGLLGLAVIILTATSGGLKFQEDTFPTSAKHSTEWNDVELERPGRPPYHTPQVTRIQSPGGGLSQWGTSTPRLEA